MSVEKICPLFLIFYKTSNNTCVKSEFELWDDDVSHCCIRSFLDLFHYFCNLFLKFTQHNTSHTPEKK